MFQDTFTKICWLIFLLIDLFLRVLLGKKKKSHLLHVMDPVILCALSFSRVGCAVKLFYRKGC